MIPILTLTTSLASTVCLACGQSKRRRHTFCGGCFYKLPRPQRDALYDLIGEGYEEAVRAALTTLVRTALWLPTGAVVPIPRDGDPDPAEVHDDR
jgi:hypothetical protein